MEFQHVNIKIFVDGELQVDLQRIIELFHRWTADQSRDEMLIDIADYRHVPNGPSVVLIGHEADYAIDNTGGRYGLLYNRKAVVEGSNADRLRQSLGAALKACDLLEGEFSGQLTFDRREFELIINDRALAPNTAQTLAAWKPELESFLADLGQTGAEIMHNSQPRRRFGMHVKLNKPLDASAVTA